MKVNECTREIEYKVRLVFKGQSRYRFFVQSISLGSVIFQRNFVTGTYYQDKQILPTSKEIACIALKSFFFRLATKSM